LQAEISIGVWLTNHLSIYQTMCWFRTADKPIHRAAFKNTKKRCPTNHVPQHVQQAVHIYADLVSLPWIKLVSSVLARPTIKSLPKSGGNQDCAGTNVGNKTEQIGGNCSNRFWRENGLGDIRCSHLKGQNTVFRWRRAVDIRRGPRNCAHGHSCVHYQTERLTGQVLHNCFD